MLRISAPWDSQPQEAIAPSSEGIASGLNIVLNPGAGLRNLLAHGPAITVNGNPTIAARPSGLAVGGFSGSNYLSFANPAGADRAASVFILMQNASTADQGGNTLTSGTGSGNQDAMPYGPSQTLYTGPLGAARWASNIAFPGSTSEMLKPWSLAVARKAGKSGTAWPEFRLYLNALLSATVTSSIADATPGATFALGVDTQTGNAYGGSIALFAMWDRELSANEIASLHANPWQLFASRTIWVPVSAATGGAYTITADAGAYVIGGQDAAIVKSRIVVADAGAYSLSGQDAALKVGHVLIADAGAYTISGQDAALLRGRVVAADAGAYALAGQDATLTYVTTAGAYTLTAEAGAYTLSGQDAALIRGRVVAADAGAYALAGQDATLTYALANAYTLTCEAGAYSLAGQNATFAFSGAATPVVATGGGIYPTPRRKTKQEIDADRKRLGILPDKPEVQTGIVETPKRPKITLEQLIGKPAADTHRADMERASAAHKLRKRRQDDDLLMMM